MIFPDRKKIAQIIVSKMKPDGSETKGQMKPEEDLSDDEQGLMSAAEDVLSAMQSQSAHELKEAMKSFYQLASSQPQSEPDADDGV